MKTELICYDVQGSEMEGFIAYDSFSSKKRPAVLVAHAWMGCDEFAKNKAIELAKLGYVGFAADVYGKGKRAKNPGEAGALMTPLFQDRSLLQTRITGAFNWLKEHPLVYKEKIGAIGFCFGGLTVLELLRSGASVKGIVSLHGVLADPPTQIERKGPYQGAALFLHGNDDPLVSQDDIQKLFKELNANAKDWQFHTYGHTVHAFTNPEAHMKEAGLVFSPVAAQRALQTMTNFLEEILS